MENQKTLTQHDKRITMMEVLYQYFLSQQSQTEFKQFLFEEEGITIMSEQCAILNELLEHEDDLTAIINKKLKAGWTFAALKPIEKAILILAAFEIVYTKIDKRIAINEAVIITKTYCPNDAYKYINGVLDKITK